MIDVYPEDQLWTSEIAQRGAKQKATVTLDTRSAPYKDITGLSVTRDSLRFLAQHSGVPTAVPLSSVREISFPSDGGPAVGAGVGALVGGTILGIMAAASVQDCGSSETWCFQIMRPEEALAGGFLIGGVAGGLLGAIIGAATGKPGVRYTFKSDTPRQFTVVIGVHATDVDTVGHR